MASSTLRLLHRLQSKLTRSFLGRPTVQLLDYQHLVSHEPARSTILGLLDNKKACYPAFVDRANVLAALQNTLDGRVDRSHEVCAYATFELWLQQVFHQRFRESGSGFCGPGATMH